MTAYYILMSALFLAWLGWGYWLFRQLKSLPATIPGAVYSLNDYQDRTPATISPKSDVRGAYHALALNGEAGELAEKIKKYWRDRTPFDSTQEAIMNELGDVLWYVSAVARDWGLSLQQVAQANLDKIASRKQRGVQHGSGDNR